MTPKKFVAFIERTLGRPLTASEAEAFQAAREDTQGKRDTVKAMWTVARELGLSPPLDEQADGETTEPSGLGASDAQSAPDATRPDAR